MGAGMTEVFALEIDLGSTETLRQTLGKIELSGPADIVLEVIGQFGLEASILPGLCVFLLQFQQGGHQRLRDVASAVSPEPAVIVRNVCHAHLSRDRNAGSINGLRSKRQP